MTARMLEFGQEILQDVLFRAGERTDLSGTNTSDYLDVAKVFVQRAYYDVLSYAPWPWALKDPPGVLSLVPKVTGTATCTQTSTSVTLGAVIATTMAGRWFEIDEKQIPYRISAHTAGSATLTLDAAYAETSVTSGAYSIYKDEYELNTYCLRIWKAWDRNDRTRQLDIITDAEMAQLYPDRSRGTYPRKLALVRGNKVRISPWPETDYMTIEYEYTEKPSADFTFDETANTDTPIVPLVDRHVIADAALVMLYNVKNDTRAGDLVQMVGQKLALMQNIYVPIGKVRLYVRRGQGVW